MKLKTIQPRISFGYCPWEFWVGLGLLGEDLDLGIYSFNIQLACWWVTIRFQVKKERRKL